MLAQSAVAVGHPLGRLVQTDAVQHPLGRDADVLAEQALERALGVAGVGAQVLDPGDRRVGEHRWCSVDDLVDARVVGPAVRAQPVLDLRERGRGEVGRRRRSAGARRSVSVCAGTGWNGWKPPGWNFVAITWPEPVQLALPALGEDAVDRAGALEGDVDARVGDDLLRVRLVEVPLDASSGGRRGARDPETAGRASRRKCCAAASGLRIPAARSCRVLTIRSPAARLGWPACL